MKLDLTMSVYIVFSFWYFHTNGTINPEFSERIACPGDTTFSSLCHVNVKTNQMTCKIEVLYWGIIFLDMHKWFKWTSLGMNVHNSLTLFNKWFKSCKVLFFILYHCSLIRISTFTYTCQWNFYWSNYFTDSQNMPWDSCY